MSVVLGTAATAACAGDSGVAHLDTPAFEAIVGLLRERTGVDFRAYRPATVLRRIRNRMLSLRLDCPYAYLELLRASADESGRLLERITIKVSRFYRHAAAFDYLRDEILPALGAEARMRTLRLHSAGCGTGEEAWTLAMLLEEAGLPGTVAASDIDAGALEAAQAGVYAPEALTELPAPLAARYLEPAVAARSPRFRIVDRLRDRVHFVPRDLTAPAAGAPAEGFDLVCCRNVLIYLLPAVQAEVLRGLMHEMRPGSHLCLGEAEWPPASLASHLVPLARGARIFKVNP